MIIMFFFFNDTATTEIYTLSLHDALPISADEQIGNLIADVMDRVGKDGVITVESSRGINFETEYVEGMQDRKSTRLNSSHLVISYAVFCLKKKKITDNTYIIK